MRQDLATVAGQYAKAIMQLSAQENADTTVLDNLKTVNRLLAETPELSVVLKHPAVPTAEKKQLVISIFTGKVHDLTARLLELLTDRGRLELLPFIEVEFTRLWRDKQNIVAGTLIFAEAPAPNVVAEIKATLTKQLGKKLELDERQDKSLIGGYILQLGDQLIDGSLKGRLQQIEKTLLAV